MRIRTARLSRVIKGRPINSTRQALWHQAGGETSNLGNTKSRQQELPFPAGAITAVVNKRSEWGPLMSHPTVGPESNEYIRQKYIGVSPKLLA